MKISSEKARIEALRERGWHPGAYRIGGHSVARSLVELVAEDRIPATRVLRAIAAALHGLPYQNASWVLRCAEQLLLETASANAGDLLQALQEPAQSPSPAKKARRGRT